ncbi:MAG: hypothetical protein RJB66_2595 [Pseudomonadota bacterium]|jgi:putative transposase
MKNLYFESMERALNYRKNGENCLVHSFCAMNNHFHQTVSYLKGWERLSATFQYGHGIFGARFNRKTSRCGAVFSGRPKTPLIQNQAHERRVHFYVESNPIRAGICNYENLINYSYSSFGFYAHGKKTRYTSLLSIPQWYLQLARTWRARQRRYRKLFELYLGLQDKKESSSFFDLYIGDDSWTEYEKKRVKKSMGNSEIVINMIKLESS